jgi:fibrillarin-like rRNA methylase
MDERDYKAMNEHESTNEELVNNSNWTYFKTNKAAILLGFAIGTTLSIVMDVIENIIIKIALIMHIG